MTTVPYPPLWRRLLSGYERLLRLLAGTSMILLLSITVMQVFTRYVLGSSPIWAEEVCRYLLIWQTFLLVGYAYTKGELMAVDILPTLLGPRANLALKLVMLIPVLIFLYLMMANGHAYALRFQRQVMPAGDFIWTSLTGGPLGLSIYWVYVSVAVGCALLALHMMAACLRDYLDIRAGVTSAKPSLHATDGAH